MYMHVFLQTFPIPSLLPKAKLTTGCSSSNPIVRRVEVSHRGHCCNTLTVKLTKLTAICSKHIDEAVHVADNKLLDTVVRSLLPLRLEDGNPSTSLVVVTNLVSRF